MSILYENIFGKSVEKSVIGQKKPTRVYVYLLPWPAGIGVTPYPPEQTLYVGTEICVRVLIMGGDPLAGISKPIDIHHRLNAGAWEKLTTVTTDPAVGADYKYTLTKAGTHTFYAEFKGDAVYEGCKVVKSFACRS